MIHFINKVKFFIKGGNFYLATVEIDQRNDKGWTALMFAARNGHVDVINTLLEKG